MWNAIFRPVGSAMRTAFLELVQYVLSPQLRDSIPYPRFIEFMMGPEGATVRSPGEGPEARTPGNRQPNPSPTQNGWRKTC
jgi:hypothetical protein